MSETGITVNDDGIDVNGHQLASLDSSVGGEMTAVLALVAKEKGGPELEFQVMLWSAMSANFATGSYQEYTDGYFWIEA